jgi:putative DNA primase/helicase
MMRAAEIHARLGSSWPSVLAQLGIADSYLQLKKPGPCPVCGGRDRYVFDNRKGRGDFYCRSCGSGDGFTLLQRLHGWSFSESLLRVVEAIGTRDEFETSAQVVPDFQSRQQTSAPTQRVLRLRRERCAIVDCQPVVDYLARRDLWPLPALCTLSAHPSVEYFHEGHRLARHAALVADVCDMEGELVTAHVTYIAEGRKLSTHEPRKLLSALSGHVGCAVRLLPIEGATLGIGEGVETCLAAAMLHNIPVWSALSAPLLAKFEPPLGVEQLHIFADRDEAGLLAAGRLMERLQGRIRCQLRVPPSNHKDFNDVLIDGLATVR